MPYTKLTKENIKKINRLFGVVAEKDLSNKEKAILEYFKKTTMEEANKQLADYNSQITTFTDEPELFFEQQLKNNVAEAVAIKNTIDVKKAAYDTKEAAYDRSLEKLDAAKAAYTNAKKNLDNLKEKQAADLAKLKTNYDKKVNEITNEGMKKDDAAKVKLSEKITKEAMQRAEKEFNKLNVERAIEAKSKYLMDLYSTCMRHANDKNFNKEAYSKKIEEVNAEIKKLQSKSFDSTKEEKKAVQKKQEALDKVDKIENKYGQKLLEAEKEYNEKVSAIQSNTKKALELYNSASDAYDKAFKENDLAKAEIDVARMEFNDAMNARKTLASTYIASLKEKKTALEGKMVQHEKLERGLANKNPRVTKDAVANGLALVNQTYKMYHSQYSKLQRFCAFLGFGAAVEDRNSYEKVRDAFIANSGVTKAEVNKYLDDGVLTGRLATYTDGKQDVLADNVNLAVGHNYEMVGKDTSKYVAEMTAYFDKNIFPAKEVYKDRRANIAIEEGLHFLNALGDQQRLHPEMNIEGLVNHCKGIMIPISASAGRGRFIKEEIDNALLPKENRHEIEPVGMTDKDLKNMMNIREWVNEAIENQDNMILGNDVFAEPVEIEVADNQEVVPMNDNLSAQPKLVLVAQ